MNNNRRILERFRRKTKDKVVEDNVVYTLDDVVDGVEIEIQPMRTLGEGRWDRILKTKITELSEADNFDDAMDEWKATGNCWWGKPDDPRRTPPTWMEGHHIGHCLCGHFVFYHFEIENTENGVKAVVGSDHIHAFMIIRAVSEEFGVDVNAVTERMIKEWLNVRVHSMLNDAWWYENGEEFNEIFDEIKELDLRINVTIHPTKKYWDRELRQFQPVVHLRKKGSGKGVRRKLASIVWRWNHPDNPDRQRDKRGFPNAKLWKDMNLFSARLEDYVAQTEKMDAKIGRRKMYLVKENDRRSREIARAYKRSEEEGEFVEKCVMFDIPEFNPFQKRVDKKDEVFLQSLHQKILASESERVLFTPRDLNKAKEVFYRIEQPLATQEDFNYLRDLKRAIKARRNLSLYFRIPRIAYQDVIHARIRTARKRIESYDSRYPDEPHAARNRANLARIIELNDEVYAVKGIPNPYDQIDSRQFTDGGNTT